MQRVAELGKSLPEGTEIRPVYDQSKFISAAIGEVKSAALLGGVLAILVLYAFLRDARATLITGIAIPVSVLGTFVLMYAFDVTLNIMSLGGLALGVGMLVDNAIVVLEAIDRKRTEEKMSRVWAAARGASEVAGAITAATLTTVAVFFPIVFVEGIAGQLFRDLALTVCSALITSLVVSLTLIPAVSAFGGGMLSHSLVPMTTSIDASSGRPRRLAGLFEGVITAPESDAGRLARMTHWLLVTPVRVVALGLIRVGTLVLATPVAIGWAAAFGLFRLVTRPLRWAFDALQRSYPAMVRGALRVRYGVLGIAVLLLAAALASLPLLGRELVPDLHQGEFGLRLELAEGTQLDVTSERAKVAEEALRERGAYERVFSLVGVLPGAGGGLETSGENLARIEVVLPEGTSAGREKALAVEARETVARMTGAEVELTRAELLGVGAPVVIEIFGEDLELLSEAAARVREMVQSVPGVTDVASTARAGQPEVRLQLDPERSAYYGLDAAAIGSVLRTAIRGDTVGKFREGDDRIDIRVRARASSRERANDVGRLLVRLESGTAVPVSALGQVAEGRGPAVIYRSSGGRLASITGQVSGRDVGTTLDEVSRRLDGLLLPPEIDARLAGQGEEITTSFGSLQLMLALAVFLVYASMASLFESLKRPFVILLTVPLGLCGVIGVLWLTSTPVSVLALIGGVMLAGIVVNNAIVLVDAISRRLREGEQLDTAIVAAGQERLRPIMMTTTTTVLALLPLALSRAPGSELRVPLAVTVIGGLTVATVLTLIVIPCAFRVAESKLARRAADELPSAGPVGAGGSVGEA
jgi:HAE1 family hydrophobic/amphiphilic exporter-1